MSPARDAALALTFLTRLRVPVRGGGHGGGGHRSTVSPLDGACAWFPLVGVLLGAALGGTRLLLELVGVPAGPATFLGVLVAVALTGSLHEDGLADLADGLGAVADPARRREIMRDPRVGASGAIAAAASVVLPVLCLAPLAGREALGAAVAAFALGRLAILPLARLLPPAEPSTSAGALRPTPAALVAAALTGVGAATLAAGWGAVVAVGCALVATALTGLLLRRAVGGLTGDGLGATVKVVELAVLVGLAAHWA